MHDVDGPELPDVAQKLVRPDAPVVARVRESSLCTWGNASSIVRHVAIDFSGTPLYGQILPGQSFGVIPPGVDAAGKPHKARLYSSASPTGGEDGHGAVYATPVKRVIAERRPGPEGLGRHDLFLGVCSNYLCDLSPGDPVAVTGPAGRSFLLPRDRNAHDYLFVATGTGIAPFRGMLLDLLRPANGPPSTRRIELIAGAAFSADLLYEPLLRELCREHANLRIHRAISREARPGAAPSDRAPRGPYVHDLIAESLDHFGSLLASDRTLIYVCGIAGAEVGLYDVLLQHDLFGPYLHEPPDCRGVPPREWLHQSARRRIRPRGRCMVEVY